MNTNTTPTLDPSNIAMRLGMCAAALAGTAGMVTDAQAVVVSFSTPIAVPATTSGVYINLLTGATGTSSASVPGWDFNPYQANGGTQLGFYWQPAPSTPRAAGVGSTTNGPYLGLAPGDVVSAASTFTSVILGTTGSPYVASGTNILGVRFFNEATSTTNYGYISITTNAAGAGFPATINGWSFENSGGAITVPSPVPEPATGVMLSMGALALGAMNLRRLRRQRRQAAC